MGEYLGLGSMLLSVAIGVIRFMGYDAAYGHSQSSDATKKANGSTTMNAILEVSSMITLASAREGVAYAFWNTLEDAEQDARVAEWEDKVDERAKEIEDLRAEMNGSSSDKKDNKPETKKAAR